MGKKTYIIGNTEFILREYGDLTGFEEEKINDLLFGNKAITGREIFPIILVPVNADTDVTAFEWRNMKNNQVSEILVDFIVQKKIFMDSMSQGMMNSVKQRILQYGSMKENTEKQKAEGLGK
jgi:hypothetical protein